MANNMSTFSLHRSLIVPLDFNTDELDLANGTLEIVPDGKEVHIIVTCVFIGKRHTSLS